MTPHKSRIVTYSVLALILLATTLILGAPGLDRASAQESTEEPPVVTTEPAPPTSEPTDAPTEAPVEPPAESTDVVAPSEQPSPTDEAVPTEAPPIVIPPLEPTEEPAFFQEDFQNGDVSDWVLSTGWALASENDNMFLMATTSGETATISGLSWEHVLLSARVGMQPGNAANIAVRSSMESYTVMVNAGGQASLYRSGILLAQGPAPITDSETTPEVDPAPVWYQVSVKAYGGEITVTVDGLPQFTYVDAARVVWTVCLDAPTLEWSRNDRGLIAVGFNLHLLSEASYT